MNKPVGANIWKAINSPIVVVIIALSMWPVLTGISTSFLISKVKKSVINATEEVVDTAKKTFQQNDAKTLEKIDISKLIEFNNIKTVPSDWHSKEKIIGTIVNNSDKILSQIRLNVSFYDAKKNLIDVEDTSLYGVKFILPKQSLNFSFKRSLGKHDEPKEILVSRKHASLKIITSDFKIVETESKTDSSGK